MKKNTLNSFSTIISLISVILALISVITNSDANLRESLKYIMVLAAILAIIGASFKLWASQEKFKREKGRIFLIYAREDKNRVEILYNDLKEAGFRPWMDTKDILPGEQWKSTIIKAIEESDLALVCISRATVSKIGFVQKELQLALNFLKEQKEGFSPVIPVRLEDTIVPERLNELQWVDLFTNDGMSQLEKALKNIVN